MFRIVVEKRNGAVRVTKRSANVTKRPDRAAASVSFPCSQPVKVLFSLQKILRSIVQGFISLEVAGGFGIPIDTDASFRWIINLYIAGLSRSTMTEKRLVTLERSLRYRYDSRHSRKRESGASLFAGIGRRGCAGILGFPGRVRAARRNPTRYRRSTGGYSSVGSVLRRVFSDNQLGLGATLAW